MGALFDAEFEAEGLEIDDVFAVVDKQDLEGGEVVVVDIIPPEFNGHPAVDAFGLAGDSQLDFDGLEAAFELVSPAVVHQIPVLELSLEVHAEAVFDEWQVETAAVVGVQDVDAGQDVGQGKVCNLRADELEGGDDVLFFDGHADDGQGVVGAAAAGGLNIQIGPNDAHAQALTMALAILTTSAIWATSWTRTMEAPLAMANATVAAVP